MHNLIILQVRANQIERDDGGCTGGVIQLKKLKKKHLSTKI